jgi:hypothetical protein
VSWKDPLEQVVFIPSEGKALSVRDLRSSIGIIRQRNVRSKEIADFRDYLHDSSESEISVLVSGTSLDDTYSKAKKKPLVDQKKSSYDIYNPTFTFKVMNYEPIPILTKSAPVKHLESQSSEDDSLTTESSESDSLKEDTLLIYSKNAKETQVEKCSKDKRNDKALAMQRSMFSRMPPFLRTYGATETWMPLGI